MTPPRRRAGILARVRRLCLGLPETTERPSHGVPAFFIRDQKMFVMFTVDHHGDGRLGLWCAAAPGAQKMLVDGDPRQYFVPPYVGYRGWVGVRLDLDPDWDAVADIVEEAYRAVAPRRLLDQLDSGDAPGGSRLSGS